MCCGCAVWQPSGTHDTPLICCVYLPVWETVAVGQNMREGVQVPVCCVCVSAVYMVLLWKVPSLGLSIYIFINHRSHREEGTEESFKCKRVLSGCTKHAQAGWQSPTSLLQYTSLASDSLPPTHTPLSSDCLPGRPDSGQLIFSSTHRLINTKTPHYSGLMENNPGKQSDLLRSKPLSLLTVLFELVAHYIPFSFTCACSHFP